MRSNYHRFSSQYAFDNFSLTAEILLLVFLIFIEKLLITREIMPVFKKKRKNS